MQITFYALSKKNKSTYVVSSSTAARSVEAQIKDKCTVEFPILLLNFEPTAYNYVYIPDWNRYYFISSWQYVVGVWEVSLTEDYLASFKDEILNSYSMVLYAHGGSDDIVDKRLPVKSTVDIRHNSQAVGGINFLTSGAGTPILTITGKGSNGVYVVDYGVIPGLIDGLDSWYQANITDYFNAVKQVIFGGSAMDNIKGAFSVPWTISASQGVTENLVLGGYPCLMANMNPIQGTRLLQYTYEPAVTNVSIPWKHSGWRRSSPYTNILIFLPLAGLFTINPEMVKNDSSLDVKYTLNHSSGDFSVIVKGHTSGSIVVTSSGNAALGLFLGSNATNYQKIGTSVAGGVAAVVGGVATILSGGAAAPAAIAIGAGIAAAATGTMDGLGGLTDGMGGLSGGAITNMGTNIEIFVYSKDLTDEPLNASLKIGKPVFKNTRVGNYTGYIQTDGFQFESSRASSTEKDMINSLLDTGIYVE